MGWIASLSNGDTVFETEPEPGEISAWQALRAFLQAHPNVRMTQIQLQQNGRTLVGIPRAQGYVQCYEVHRIIGGAETQYQGIGSVVGDQVFLNWINENGNVWQDVRPLSDLRVHSTLVNEVV